MRQISKSAATVIILFLVVMADIPYLSQLLVPEAQALRGRGAAFAIGAAAGSASTASAEAEAAAAQQQAAAAQQQAAEAEQQLAIEKEKAATSPPPTAAPGSPLPLGTVVASLPAECTPTPVGDVNYYYCGGNFYQAVFEGSTLKYVTTKPQ